MVSGSFYVRRYQSPALAALFLWKPPLSNRWPPLSVNSAIRFGDMHAFCSTKVGSSTIDASYVARAQANGQCKLRRWGQEGRLDLL
jgi:hypothetical protein